MLSASFSIGVSGLKAFQLKADTHSHNIANANTPNFRRQLITLSEAPAQFKDGFWYGRGVVVGDVRKASDPFTRNALNGANEDLAQLNKLADTLGKLDALVGSASTEFSSALNKFRETLTEGAKQPDSLPVRQAIIEAGKGLTSAYTGIQNRFSEIQSSNQFEKTNLLSMANLEAGEIASMNSTLLGTPNQALQDSTIAKANSLISKIGGSWSIAPNGTISVNGEKGTPLVVGTTTQPITEAYASGGAVAGINTGIARTTEVETFITQVTSEFFSAMNAVHAGNTDLVGGTPQDLFVATGTGYTFGISAPKDLGLAQGGGPVDNRGALALIGGSTAKNTQGGLATLTESWAQQLVKTGAEASSVNDRIAGLESFVSDLNNTLKSSEGVNLDEELVQLLQAQRMYEANAKVIQIADSLIGTLLDIRG